MRIGTVRAEEARVFDSHAGCHRFHQEETQEEYGSFEIFWHNGKQDCRDEDSDGSEPLAPGWYWWARFPGCMPDGEANGPFADSRQALQDADEWSPEFDD
jgi:hypothetical protein